MVRYYNEELINILTVGYIAAELFYENYKCRDNFPIKFKPFIKGMDNSIRYIYVSFVERDTYFSLEKRNGKYIIRIKNAIVPDATLIYDEDEKENKDLIIEILPDLIIIRDKKGYISQKNKLLYALEKSSKASDEFWKFIRVNKLATHTEYEDLKADIKNKEIKIINLKKEIEKLKEENNALKEKIEKIKKEFENKIKKLKKENETLKKERNRLKEEIKRKIKETYFSGLLKKPIYSYKQLKIIVIQMIDQIL